MDKDGKCDVEMKSMVLFGNEPFKTIPPEDKKVGDLNLAFFPSSQEEEKIRN